MVEFMHSSVQVASNQLAASASGKCYLPVLSVNTFLTHYSCKQPFQVNESDLKCESTVTCVHMECLNFGASCPVGFCDCSNWSQFSYSYCRTLSNICSISWRSPQPSHPSPRALLLSHVGIRLEYCWNSMQECLSADVRAESGKAGNVAC